MMIFSLISSFNALSFFGGSQPKPKEESSSWLNMFGSQPKPKEEQSMLKSLTNMFVSKPPEEKKGFVGGIYDNLKQAVGLAKPEEKKPLENMLNTFQKYGNTPEFANALGFIAAGDTTNAMAQLAYLHIPQQQAAELVGKVASKAGSVVFSSVNNLFKRMMGGKTKSEAPQAAAAAPVQQAPQYQPVPQYQPMNNYYPPSYYQNYQMPPQQYSQFPQQYANDPRVAATNVENNVEKEKTAQQNPVYSNYPVNSN